MKRTKEEIMERFYEKARKMDITPEELAGVPWTILEQMLFPEEWAEENEAAGQEGDGSNREICKSEDRLNDNVIYDFESEPMRVEESNRTHELYNSVIAGKKQGRYTIQDYYDLPDNIRAELIDGEMFYKSSPSYLHQLVLFETAYQISTYIRKNRGECHVLAAPLDVQLDCDEDSMLQPDIIVSCKKERREEWGIYGAPDMVVEITSPSTRFLDMKKKLDKYREAGVREYWIIDLQKRVILTYFFEGDINPHICNFENDISVAIFENECKVSYSAISEELNEALKAAEITEKR